MSNNLDNPFIQRAERIYAALRVKEGKSILQLSKEVGISWRTAKSFIQFIRFVQGLAKLEIMQTSQGPRYIKAETRGRKK